MNTKLGISSTARRKTVYSVIAGSILFLLSFILIPETLPDSSSAEAGVVPTPSLTFSGSHALNLIVNPGQFATSDTQNLIVETTNYTGYTMTIAPTTGNSTDLVNTSVNTYTIPSIASTTTADSFEGLSTAAYGLSTDDGTTYLPITNGGELYSTNAATDSTTGGMTIKLGAKAISSTPSGDYTKAFTLTTLANATVYYSITYNKNTEDNVSSLPSPISGTVTGTGLVLSSNVPGRTGFRFAGWNTRQDGLGTTYAAGSTYALDPETQNSVTLYAMWDCARICYHGNGADAGEMEKQSIDSATTPGSSGSGLHASNFSRAGYGFAGWSADKDAYTHLTDSNQNNDPTIFGPNQTLTANDAGNGLDLYAVWVPAEKDDNKNPVYLQGWTGCSTLKDREVIALTDNRDGNVYAVTKIKKVENDVTTYEKCWLIENLRLDVATANITSANTDSPTRSFVEEATALSSAFWDTCTSKDSACFDHISYGLGNTNGSATPDYSGGAQNTPWYSYGGMYNWYTATAGRGTYYRIAMEGSVSGSICPSGWNLPSGKDATGDFGELDIALGGTGTRANSDTTASNRWRTYPINMVYSGNYNGTKASLRGTTGCYWSSTPYTSSKDTYSLYVDSYGITPGMNFNEKYDGFAVRCLAGSTELFTITYDANGGDASSVPAAQTSATQANGFYTFTLSNTTPTRSGFTFAGWIDEDGFEVAPGGQYTATRANATLYARWTNNDCKSNATTIGTGNSSTDAVCLQDVNDTVKSAMVSKQTYTLTDARDNQSYTISKLDDGIVWMTQNLNYGSSSDTLLTSYDTDLPSYSTFKAPASTTAFETSDNMTTRVTPKILTDSTYGGYYSFAAAVASINTFKIEGQNITTSICPVGWDLPTSAQYDNLKAAANLVGYNAAHAAPYSFTDAGLRNGNNFYGQGSDGYIRLWTSTNYSETYAYYSKSYENASRQDIYKRYGYSVRCIASPQYQTLTLSFDTTKVTSVEIDGTSYNNGDTISLVEGSTHTIDMTFESGYKFDNWSVSGTGSSVASASTQSTTITIGSASATLTATAKPIISFDGAFAAANKTKQNGYYTMQDMDATICSAVDEGQTGTLLDTRTTTGTGAISTPIAYSVAKINNECWMTQNLRITGTIPASGSNFSGSSFSISEQFADSNSSECSGTGLYINCYAAGTDSEGDPTVWYSYKAASAGTISSSTTDDATSDICPAGWHLPSSSQGQAIASASALALFQPVAGGRYSNTGLDSTDQGMWWTSQASNASNRYNINYLGSNSAMVSSGGVAYGYYVRCVSEAAANNANNNSNNNNSQQNSQQQNAEPQAVPQATPSAAPAAQSMSFSASPAATQAQPTNNNEPTDTEDQTEEEADSKAANVAPLGVKRSSGGKTDTAADTVASTGVAATDNTDVYGIIALAGAGVATTSGLLLLAGNRRKDDEEDEPEA